MDSSLSPKSEASKLASHILFKDHALKLARCLSSLEENRIHLARQACWVQGSFGLSCLSPLLSLRGSCRQFGRQAGSSAGNHVATKPGYISVKYFAVRCSKVPLVCKKSQASEECEILISTAV